MKNNKALKTGLQVLAGTLAAGALSNIEFVKANPAIQVAAPVAIAMLLGKQVGPAVAAGMVVGAGQAAIKAFVPTIAPTVGLGAVASASVYTPGVAGAYNGYPSVVVQ